RQSNFRLPHRYGWNGCADTGAQSDVAPAGLPGINAIAAGAGEALDPHFQPNRSDQFDFTIQRQLSSKVMIELGYIGRRVTHEYQPINGNAVPYMMTLGGQRFDKAYAAVETQYCGLTTPNCAMNA